MDAKLIQDLLNTTELPFRITNERQEYEIYCKEDGISGILVQLNSGYLFDEVGNKITPYQIEFFGRNANFEAFKEALKNFPDNEYLGDFLIYSQKPTFDDFFEEGGGLQFTANLVFQTVEIIGGVSGLTTTIQVDGQEIDFMGVLYRQDKSLLPAKEFGNHNNVKAVNELLTLTLPISDNAKNKELLFHGLNDSYNKKYTVRWSIGGIIKTFDATLRVNLVEYGKNYQPIAFKITFERALPREIWQLSLFNISNFWDITETNELLPFDESHVEDISTIDDMETYLQDFDKLDSVGYTIRVEKTPPKRWFLLAAETDGSLAYDYELPAANFNFDDELFFDFLSTINTTAYELHEVLRVKDTFTDTYWYAVVNRAVDFNLLTPHGTDHGDYSYYNENIESLAGEVFSAQSALDFLNEWKGADDYNAGTVVRIEVQKHWRFIKTTDGVADPFIIPDIVIEDTQIGLNNQSEFINYLNTNHAPIREEADTVALFIDDNDIFWYARIPQVYWFGRLEYAEKPAFFYGKVLAGGSYGNPKELGIIEWGFTGQVEQDTRTEDGIVRNRPNYWSKNISAIVLVDNNSQILFDDYMERKGFLYKIEFELNGKTYTAGDMVISGVRLSTEENPNIAFEVAFVEGETWQT